MTVFVSEVVLLSTVVLLCWLGVLGMWRMKQPTQALHYLSLPGTAGAILLAFAVLIHQGISQASGKVFLIALILLAANSVVTHATAHAFRLRKFGRWEPRDGDPIELVGEDEQA
jgi:multisubunit Na+/H+ antiporter MnhG subunit